MTDHCYLQEQHRHEFTTDEEVEIREFLLKWYGENKRDLPWRRLAVAEQDRNKRGYAVWVSEVMLQQTQVATVIDYYNKWMDKWPTLQDLADASLEEVNEVWSGLGYYSRGRRLHEGAKKVCEELNGNMPKKASTLQSQLPGVGRYTAGAIASIAFDQTIGVVDGNVIRVLSRLRQIGADCTSNAATAKFWELANSLVDNLRPGDFNQAMMELGATICTPKSPKCSLCPLKNSCMAFKHVEKSKKGKLLLESSMQKTKTVEDVEDCNLCLTSWDPNLGICNYPTKPKKKEPKTETFGACLVQKQNSHAETTFLMIQRPDSGLLAGLWEFPNVKLNSDKETEVKTTIMNFLNKDVGLSKVHFLKEIGDIKHKFSHRLHTYKVYLLICDETMLRIHKKHMWASKVIFQDSAIPTAMRKIFSLYENTIDNVAPPAIKRKKLSCKNLDNQKTMDSFLKPK